MKITVIAALSAATMVTGLLPAADPASAATVRRHLRCELVPMLMPGAGGIVPTLGQAAQITNTWAMVIPKGTTYSLTVSRRTSTFKSSKALGQGQALVMGSYSGVNPPTCIATVPG